MYLLKQRPEDFYVQELASLPLQDAGPYMYCRLWKRNYSTLRAIEHIASALHIPSKSIGYAGNKDKNAITEQYVSIKGNRQLPRLRDISLALLGYGRKPLGLGDHKGNAFVIVVRRLTRQPEKKDFFPNYFGEQRFSQSNHEVGKALVHKQFARAVQLIQEQGEDHAQQMRPVLQKRPNDHVGALKRLSPKLLSLFVHSYQSMLWNRIVARLLEAHPSMQQTDVPVVGFGTELGGGVVAQTVQEVLREEQLILRDFIIPSIPRLSAPGDLRPLYADLSDLQIGELEHDELNDGYYKCRISFSLGKGVYATVAIDQLVP